MQILSPQVGSRGEIEESWSLLGPHWKGAGSCQGFCLQPSASELLPSSKFLLGKKAQGDVCHLLAVIGDTCHLLAVFGGGIVFFA